MKEIKNLENVDKVSYDLSNSLLTITYKKGNNNIAALIDFFKNNKIKFNSIYSERPTLNDVFLELTGKELRD